MSLRTRLLVAIGVIALVALVIADVVTYSALQSFLYQRVDQQLTAVHPSYEFAVNSGRGYPCFGGPNQELPNPDGGSGPAHNNGPSTAFQAVAVEVRTASGALVAGSTCPLYVDGKAYTPVITGTITGFSTATDGTQVAFFDAPSAPNGGPTLRVRASTLDNGELLVLSQPLSDVESTLDQLRVIELIVTIGAVIIALAAGYWLVRLGLRPLGAMESAAESIAEGNLTERVPGENEKTEVGRLARTLNIMLSRIEEAFRARVASEERLRESDARLRRFVGDASHELRTPIAAISAYAELFGRGASENKMDLERLMVGIRSETGRMEHLVADLLLLARLDEGRPMDLHPVDLTALCGEAVQTSTAVGPAWPVSFSAPRPIEVVGDATSLRQVVDNLLGNVRSHTPEGTITRGLGRAGRDRRPDHRGRRRPRHGARRGGARLRAVLPVGSEPVPPARRCRARTVHRLGHRGRPRGHGHRHQRTGPRHHVHRATACVPAGRGRGPADGHTGSAPLPGTTGSAPTALDAPGAPGTPGAPPGPA